MYMEQSLNLSIVIPVCNEEESIGTLVNEIDQVLERSLGYEIIVVDDGSRDATLSVLSELKQGLDQLRVVRHLQNSGQSTAIRTGVKAANAPWIATLDGDGQNDPADIPKLYWKLTGEENSDPLLVVAGHRKKRKDHWFRSFYSRIANRIRANLLRDETPDTGCGLKIFSRDRFLDLPYFDHMHRYIPALFIRQGGRVVSVEVNHRSREQGSSKYGFHNRFWVGIMDLLGVRWLLKRAKTPAVEEL
ncbi:MAG: glycosyltransferase family 2 protein [Gammaproteobacteria bacterium]|jgi:dolichol-phosphate mannosyltransferase|nr:glycosyltransferase family 2 protein [Gammaproteobacteria bacterium]MBT4132585.1 glycosyltransferase family 2 protein [Candidatus Neomarinimicrobiota bacterium]MBT4605502.1 glycosyltransferase family 2 protein [Thiotrichales bacterium]MBT4328746.1 glycosyltransferase family 2 protein [Gammaproteobacteria bacterium]MBT5747091.1 glycosyltransferase family 2 protein [Gammaproteobacteria bacterium]